MLRAQAIDFTLAGHAILNGVSLALNAGEFVGLIGPNGAGKTSLLRVMAGLREADSGEIYIDQSSSSNTLKSLPSQTRAKLLAYLAQQEKPAWPLAVKHLVGLGRAPWRKPLENNSEHKQAIARALQLTDLTSFADRPINSLSGGELQRALLARVFAGDPKIIIADEPIAALDPYHQLHIMELLRDHSLRGGAVIAALHDLSLAARYCHRLILLHHGRIVADGEPVHVLTPENLQQVYGITAYVDCREDGVVVIPKQRVRG
jgi:ABC-type cobalamin/Fe3+-siderophores transport system ATPase subunit